MFLIIVNVLGHPKGVGELTSYFLCGGGMDVFWNDPFLQSATDVYVLKVQFLTSEMTTYIGSFSGTTHCIANVNKHVLLKTFPIQA